MSTNRNKKRETKMSDHAKLSPSAAARWMRCPGSVALTANMPDVTSTYAEEGTLAHTLAEVCLNNNIDTADLIGSEYTDEMRGYVQRHLDYVRDIAGDNKIFTEKRLDLGEYIPGGFGTADVLIIDKKNATLHVIDLKYGMGKVDAKDNEQLYIYALGAISKIRDMILSVVVHISQPRLGHYDSHGMWVHELDEFSFTVAKAAALCETDNAPLNPSEKACQWCLARATCTALYQHTTDIVGEDFDMLTPAKQLTDAQLKAVLDNKGLIEKWLKAIEAEVFSRVERGESFPGYKMVEGRSVRKWTDNAEEVLVKLLGDEAYEKKLANITTVEKKLGKKHLAELGITVKPEGKPTMVPDTDSRQAVGTIVDDFDTI